MWTLRTELWDGWHLIPVSYSQPIHQEIVKIPIYRSHIQQQHADFAIKNRLSNSKDSEYFLKSVKTFLPIDRPEVPTKTQDRKGPKGAKVLAHHRPPQVGQLAHAQSLVMGKNEYPWPCQNNISPVHAHRKQDVEAKQAKKRLLNDHGVRQFQKYLSYRRCRKLSLFDLPPGTNSRFFDVDSTFNRRQHSYADFSTLLRRPIKRLETSTSKQSYVFQRLFVEIACWASCLPTAPYQQL